MSRRRLEFAILGFGALFLVVLAFSFRPGRRPSRGSGGREALPSVPADQEAGQATTVLKGFDYTETLRGKPLFRIQSDRTVGFGPAAGLVPNVYVLEKVTLTVYPEQGEAVTVRSDRAEYDQRTKQAKLTGNVRWTDGRGALGETDHVEFEPAKKLLMVPQAVHFTRGHFDLTSRSGRYDLASRQVLLDGPVRGIGTGEGSGGLTSLSAEKAAYKREESLVELSGQVSAAAEGGDRLSCDRLVLKLEAEGGRLNWTRAEGRVRGIFASAPPSGTAAGKSAGGPRRYAADSAAVLFGPEGRAQSLSLSGSPAEVADDRGRVRAETIEVSFEAGRATAAAARGHVHVDSEKNRADSDRATLIFGPTGDIQTMELSGNVRMRGEERSAQAEKAVDILDRGAWILTGEGGSATVEGSGSRVSAARLEIDEKRRLLTAEGNARAVFTPPEKGSASEPVRKTPALLGDSKKPTYGKARRMVFDDTARVATLSGTATLWQETSSISGDDITLNDSERTLVAVGNTRTVLLSSEGQAKSRTASANAPAEPPAPTVVTARRVTHREKETRAVFEGNVNITRGGWRADAEQATAILGNDRKVERVELAGSVSFADAAEGRSGRAERATDWPREGKTVLEGSPAWVADAQGNRVTGAVLTITEHGRRVEMTAPPGGKTETIHRTKSS
jgi:LPS export ABC transporter protein LptC